MAWFKVAGSRFTGEGKTDSWLLTVNREPKTLVRYVVYGFGSIVNPAKLLPKFEPCLIYAGVRGSTFADLTSSACQARCRGAGIEAMSM